MAKLNENFFNLKKNYLFIDIGKRVKAYSAAHPEANLIRMGIGDVTQPLAPVVVDAMVKAAKEMGVKETFRGYEDSGAGYDFLREAVSNYYKSFGAEVDPAVIHISDGAKSDCGNIIDIFGEGNTVVVTDPAYPVYVDSNIMSGNSVVYANSTEENGFAAMPPKDVKAGIIYLCSPNNPTGSVYTKAQLKEWVDYALANEAVIIFDAAYEAFITDPELPRSIYLVDGAKKCAIEICSLSKTAGLPALAAATPSFPRSLSRRTARARKLRLPTCGTDARAVSSTAFPTRYSALPRLCSLPRDRRRPRQPSRTTRRTRVLSRTPATNWGLSTPAESTPRTSGSRARTAWTAGNSSTTC